MSTYLYRLGAMAFDHRRAMLAAWLAVFVGVIAAAFAFSGKTNNSFTVPGTESQQAQELLEEKFPAASGAYARMVFEAPEGTTLDDPAVKAGVMASVEQAGAGAEVIGVIDPYTAGTHLGRRHDRLRRRALSRARRPTSRRSPRISSRPAPRPPRRPACRSSGRAA